MVVVAGVIATATMDNVTLKNDAMLSGELSGRESIDKKRCTHESGQGASKVA